MNSDEAPATLIEACPGIEPAWQEHLDFWSGEEPGAFNDIAVIVHHLVDLGKKGETATFPQVFATVEHCLSISDEDARGLIVVGLLEGLQNVASWTEKGCALFEPWLGLATRKAWRELEGLWEGKESLMDVIRSYKKSKTK